MTKRESRLLAALCLFLGIVLGFLLSPVKSGICVGNSNNRITRGEEKKII
jgi:hypothetical protein